VDEIIVDLLAKACGVNYDEAAHDQEHIEIDGVDVPIASNARSSGRKIRCDPRTRRTSSFSKL
jgi:hypothetical protein